MNTSTQTPAPTFESVWALLQENARQMAENDRVLSEKFAETDRQIAETNRQIAETNRQMTETDRQISRLEKQIGGVTNSHGQFAEEYFVNSLRQGKKTLLGEKFDKLIKAAVVEDDKNKVKAEFDIILVNGKSVAIIEVKFRARDKDMDKVLKKVKPFRAKFPEYQKHKLYLGLASMVFDENIENKCKENGIAIIKQVGDTVVIHDENLKTF